MRFDSPAVRPVVGFVNARVAGLLGSARWGRFVGRQLVMVTYTGRRSGRTFTIPVGYRRRDDVVTIAVVMPDAKSWWRNFLGEGGPITLHLGGPDGEGRDGRSGDRTGHAVARRDDEGGVVVTVRLDG
ncbi:MAG: hypothetical protein OJJ54_10325 [Pseudonocardia sp.]|nr:hypothetical protein [Pseudonocardia sp.]